MRIKTHRHYAGFTLLEVVIAMSIFAIVSIMAYSGLHSVINSKTRTEEALNRLQELQLSMLAITGDLQHLTPRTIQDALGGQQLSLTTQYSDFIVTFTRSGWRNPGNQVRSTLQRVAYLLDDDKLVRRHWLHVDRANENQFLERTLITNIESLSLRFLDEKRQWREDWPSINNSAATTGGTISPPIAVEVTLKMNDWGEIKRLVKVVRE